MGQEIKQVKGKIIFKHQTAAEWDNSNNGAGAQYVPDVGERVLYDPDVEHPYTREKFGDGVHIVKDLPFSVGIVEVEEVVNTEASSIKQLSNKIASPVEVIEVSGKSAKVQKGEEAFGPYQFSLGFSDNVGIDNCLNTNVPLEITTPVKFSIYLKNNLSQEQEIELNCHASSITSCITLPAGSDFQKYEGYLHYSSGDPITTNIG